MTALRGIAFVVGLALLAATAHATISATGGYGTAHSWVTIAIAFGVAVSALAIGASWAHRRKALAVWLGLAIVAGEAFGLLMTAERLVTAREDAQAPLRRAQQAHEWAQRRVADAESSLRSLPTSSPRLAAALAAKAAADQAAIDKSAERGCRVNCRQLLQAQVDAAAKEVEEARAEIAARAETAKSAFDGLKAELAALKAPASATPLADRLGVEAWLLDLIAAALGSIAANGLGCGLIAFAGHHRHRKQEHAVMDIAATQVRKGDPHAFAYERLHPANEAGAGVDVMEILTAYSQWCRERRLEPLPGPDLAHALLDLFSGAGVPIAERNGKTLAMGLRLEAGQPGNKLLALPAN